jgi:hypothetical protein
VLLTKCTHVHTSQLAIKSSACCHLKPSLLHKSFEVYLCSLSSLARKHYPEALLLLF